MLYENRDPTGDPELSVVMTALWRLDRVLCGSADHLADETLRRAASVSHGKPLMSAEDRKLCPCRIVSRGIWPPTGLLPAEPEEEE